MRRYNLGLYEKSMPGNLSIEEKLRFTSKAGFDYLELSIDETDEKLERLKWSKEKRAELKNSVTKTNVPIYSICLSGHRRYPLGHPDEVVRKRSLEIMSDAVTLAADLGVRIIQIAGYDVYYEDSSVESREFFAHNIELAVEMAAEKGVILAFETMETEFIDTVSKAVEWINKVNSPYLQIYPDLGNITNASLIYGNDVIEDLKAGQGHITSAHLKETVPGVYREVPYGTGSVNFQTACEELLRMGVRMFVGEFWYTGEENWEDRLSENNRFLRTAIEAGCNKNKEY